MIGGISNVYLTSHKGRELQFFTDIVLYMKMSNKIVFESKH